MVNVGKYFSKRRARATLGGAVLIAASFALPGSGAAFQNFTYVSSDASGFARECAMWYVSEVYDGLYGMDYHLVTNNAQSGPLGSSCNAAMNVDPPRLRGYAATYYSFFGSNFCSSTGIVENTTFTSQLPYAAGATCGSFNYSTSFTAYYKIWGASSYTDHSNTYGATWFDG